MSPKPYKSIGFGAMDVTKPYKSIGFGAPSGTLTWDPGRPWPWTYPRLGYEYTRGPICLGSHACLGFEYMSFGPAGNGRFLGSGRPRWTRETPEGEVWPAPGGPPTINNLKFDGGAPWRRTAFNRVTELYQGVAGHNISNRPSGRPSANPINLWGWEVKGG